MACGTHFKQGFNVQVPNPEPIFPYFWSQQQYILASYFKHDMDYFTP
jgi:hypothetical protein